MSRKLRVLVLTPDFPPARGGIQLLVHRIVHHAERLETRVVTIGDAAGRAWDARCAPGTVRAPRLPSHRLSIVGFNATAVAEARRFRPDVVLAAHIVAAPAAFAICRVLRVPSVLYLYAKEIGASPGLSRFALRHSSLAIVISEYTRQLALEAGARPERLRTIPPGVDVVPFNSVTRHERPTVLTIARLEDHYKGHDVMVRALPLVRARVPRAQWAIIGDGPLRATIHRLVHANHVEDGIRLLGSVSDDERDWWLDRSHVFCMPSRLPAGRSAGEGFGIVYLEAGLHGVPAVAGNVGGAVDAVEHGKTGLLVDPSSALAIADGLADLLLDEKRREAMGRAGRERALTFGWENIVPRVEDVLFEAARGIP